MKHFTRRKANIADMTQTKFLILHGIKCANQLFRGNLSGKTLLNFIMSIGEGDMTVRELHELMEY